MESLAVPVLHIPLHCAVHMHLMCLYYRGRVNLMTIVPVLCVISMLSAFERCLWCVVLLCATLSPHEVNSSTKSFLVTNLVSDCLSKFILCRSTLGSSV